MLVLELDENCLSVGQIIEHGYFLLFGDYLVDIFGIRAFENVITRIQMTNNIYFPLSLEYVNHVTRRVTVEATTLNWHRRFDHLNIHCLKDLQEKELVYSLLEIQDINQSV